MKQNTAATCKDCGTPDGIGWWVGRMKHPGAAGPRCHSCYLAYTRRRQKPHKRQCELCGTTNDSVKRGKCAGCVIVKPSTEAIVLTPRTCDECGTTYQPQRVNGRYCSRPCNRRAYMRRQGWTPAPPKPPAQPKSPASRIYLRTCTMCDRAFVARAPSAKMCSEECRLANISDRLMGLYRAALSVPTLNVKLAMHWHRDLCRYLVERDGHSCQICGQQIDLTLTSGPRGNRQGPSVDHVVPRSRGGSDDLSNLRLTHWSCNHRRGNRGDAEQLRLIG